MNKQARSIPFAFSKSGTLTRLLESNKRITVMRGGTRSGKTYAMLQVIARWLITGELRDGEFIPKGNIGIVRKFATTLKATVLREFKAVLFAAQDNMKCQFQILENKTDRTFIFGDRMVEFIGADDEQKLRGYKSSMLYCNEGNELAYQKEFFQLFIRCSGPTFIDFNPSDEYVWINIELEQKRHRRQGDIDVLVSTYKDNPWLSVQQIEEIENLEYTNPALWQVYGKGEYGVTEGLVIPSITIIEDWPDWIDNEIGGLDFGFTNDPTSFYRYAVRTIQEEVIDKEGNPKIVTIKELYCDQLIYETGLNEGDLKNRFADLEIDKSLKVIADSSAPATINALKRAGYNVKGVKKLKGSVVTGVNQMRSMRIFVTKRSDGAIKEQQRYKFKRHVNGSYLNTPVDADNHFFDGTRYALTVLDKKRKMSVL